MTKPQLFMLGFAVGGMAVGFLFFILDAMRPGDEPLPYVIPDKVPAPEERC